MLYIVEKIEIYIYIYIYIYVFGKNLSKKKKIRLWKERQIKPNGTKPVLLQFFIYQKEAPKEEVFFEQPKNMYTYCQKAKTREGSTKKEGLQQHHPQ